MTLKELIDVYRTNLILVFQMIDATPKLQHTELDLLDALHNMQEVVRQRLSASTFEERKGDAGNHYDLLFDSIRLDVIDSTKSLFSADGHCKGVALQKMNTVVIDSLIDVLKHVGPYKGLVILDKLFSDNRQIVINSLGVYDKTEAKSAYDVLTDEFKKRQRANKKPLTYGQRMQAIQIAVEKYCY